MTGGCGAEIAWQLQWPVPRPVRDGALEEYFQAHRRELDGTELSVSTFFPVPKRPRAAVEPLIAKAEAPSRDCGQGDLFCRRRAAIRRGRATGRRQAPHRPAAQWSKRFPRRLSPWRPAM